MIQDGDKVGGRQNQTELQLNNRIINLNNYLQSR